MSENAPMLFRDSGFVLRAVPIVRLTTPWNSIYEDPVRLSQWLDGARAVGARPLVAFANATGCDGRCSAPTAEQLATALSDFRTSYPWVDEFTPWNEANVAAATAAAPERAAAWYDALVDACPTCTIVAGDVLDNGGMLDWIGRYRAALRHTPELWGLHNYFDGRDEDAPRTRAFLDAVGGDVWLTETGGIVRTHGVVFGEQNAARSLQHVWDIATGFSERIRRVYIYSWFGEDAPRPFDAGLLDAQARPRPALATFDRALSESRAVADAEPLSAPHAEPGSFTAAPGSSSRTYRTGARVIGVRWLSQRALRVEIWCAGLARCSGGVVLATAAGALARCRFSVRAERRARAVLRLGRQGAKEATQARAALTVALTTGHPLRRCA